MSKCIGIDLGTTNSCVAVVEGKEKNVIQNDEGRRTTPSIVGFSDNGERKIGDPAKRQAITNPKNTIYSVKRLMGKKYDSVKEIRFPYTVEKGSNGTAVITVNDKKYTPQEISAMVLQKMKKTAEDYLGSDVKEAVITVPAYFNDSERQSVKEAGEIAGLEVKRIINEPTAAALAYGLDDDKDRKIVVYDVGGGTTDVSILDLGDGVFEVKSTAGNSLIGGDNFDEEVINWLAEEFKKDYGIDLRDDQMANQRLKEAAEKAKIELSTTTSTDINLPYIMPVDGIPKHLNVSLSRSKFEQLIDNYLSQIEQLCVESLDKSGLKKEDISDIILVGGSTRIPAVQNLAEKIFGKKPSKSMNPDEAVAIGAAIQGGVLSGDVDDVLLLDVTPLDLGIETMGGVMTKLVEANTTIPTSKSEVFSTASDNQPSVEIHVVQGNRPMAKDNKSLGRFHLDGIPPAPRGVPQIEVKLDIDANGILNVSAHDKGTGKQQSIRIEGSSNLDESEVERMKKEAEENAEKDKKAKEEIDVMNKAESLIFQTEKQIKEFDDKLSDDDKGKLNSIVDDLKKSKESKDVEQINQKIEELTQVWNEISSKMYQQGQTNTEESQEKDESDHGGTQDADFEEVK